MLPTDCAVPRSNSFITEAHRPLITLVPFKPRVLVVFGIKQITTKFRQLAKFMQRKWRGLDNDDQNELYSAYKAVQKAGYQIPRTAIVTSANPFAVGKTLTPHDLAPWVIAFAEILREEEKANRPPSLIKRLTSRLVLTHDR
ncbi:MAG: hypothetical protein PHW63_02000 [Alphaproteobacteria bacterium]|nr:hypothetical protein [Alphaproteobacteria bacterium]